MNKIMRSFAGKFFLFATSIATLVFAEEKIFSKYLYDWFTMVTRIRLSINVSEIQNIQLYIDIVAGIAAWVWLIVRRCDPGNNQLYSDGCDAFGGSKCSCGIFASFI